MPHHYLQHLTTAPVAAAQQRYGSRAAIERMIAGWDTDALLGADEITFITARDGFYLATVNTDGWPYLQYRGGPPGFLHPLDPVAGHSVLAWADVRGNRQYLSVGNLGCSPRVSLFLMDYAHRRRLKILGTATVHDIRDGMPAHLAGRFGTLRTPGVVERLITVEVHSYDWNCPQHITPRWNEAELHDALAPIRDQLTQLQAENDALRDMVRRNRFQQHPSQETS
ncbi:pyridoxamine 5'-phosphate oxidase [Actinoplanes sp. SE50]|uniref:pyridoxamine 5'-phosphate oxidase family protein n=1 Tax=unclassified Actinoplanes TaxID=2626549 RepID=UPI00023ECBBB|nr:MULTISPECIES: pyridoxamine 5'-phosphate oxidase family protein [unclassified Actinoplanes]AEV87141.1 Pyridoxamine 5'-phosphate oxidase [Actinoplanes sp. SE50/110]ATO85539.1 pyridoxamine 5'-phosphate oxidase [Actinoplanes sp. SE50]SLM02952.1 pyridoxamine 5'-phosphate oxidase [Actinoplanes sp. SE50/110]